MKKYLIVVGIIFLIFAGFTIYGNRIENEAKEQEASIYLKEREERKNNQINDGDEEMDLFIPTEPPPDIYDDNGEVINRSIMQMLPEEIHADYEYMWQVLEENYPYFGVAERKYGVDKEQIKQKYSDEINEKLEWYRKRQADVIPDAAYWFSDLIDRCLSEFNSLGDLGYVDPSIYSRNKYELARIEYYNNIYSNEKSLDVYKLLQAETPPDITDNNYDNDNVSFEILDDNTAYMKIKSMSPQYIALDWEKIQIFYSEITDCDNLIIDLTQCDNSSMNDIYYYYWQHTIVQPNIDKITTSYISMLMKSGSENINYINIFELHSRLTDYTPNQDDANASNASEMFGKLLTLELTHYPKDYFAPEIAGAKPVYSKLFYGNIYLLINKSVAAGAENFAMFCKNTGFATIVGTQSAGNRTMRDFVFLYPATVRLPNSGLIFQYSPMYVLNGDGSCNAEYGTMPDYLCEEGETPLKACLRVIAETAEQQE